MNTRHLLQFPSFSVNMAHTPCTYNVSKMGDRVASAAICSNMARSTRLPNNVSIFGAELYAITLAMDLVRHSRNSNFSYYLNL